MKTERAQLLDLCQEVTEALSEGIEWDVISVGASRPNHGIYVPKHRAFCTDLVVCVVPNHVSKT